MIRLFWENSNGGECFVLLAVSLYSLIVFRDAFILVVKSRSFLSLDVKCWLVKTLRETVTDTLGRCRTKVLWTHNMVREFLWPIGVVSHKGSV